MYFSVVNLLTKEEDVLWRGAPNGLCYILSAVTHKVFFDLFLMILSFAIADGVITVAFSLEALYSILSFLLFFFFIFLNFAGQLSASSKKMMYMVTNQKIVIEDSSESVESDNFKIIRYSEIRKLSITENWIERLMHRGTIHIFYDGGEYKMIGVQGAYVMAKIMEDAIEGYKEKIGTKEAEASAK